jgi:hypothetical protein
MRVVVRAKIYSDEGPLRNQRPFLFLVPFLWDLDFFQQSRGFLRPSFRFRLDVLLALEQVFGMTVCK